MKRFLTYAGYSALAIIAVACKSFIEIDPPQNQIVSSTVYLNDASAESAMAGIYSQLIETGDFASGGQTSVTALAALSSDDLLCREAGDYTEFNTNALQVSNSTVADLWTKGYKFIYYTNAMLGGLASSTGMTAATKQTLEGEARFIRAFCYFYLVNLYGDVPLVTSTDYRVTIGSARSPAADIYQLITDDLETAKALLPENYADGQRIKPIRPAAAAMLARVYLFRGMWEKAIAEASEVIARNDVYTLVDLDDVFLMNSNEAIWQLMPVTPSLNTQEGFLFLPLGNAPNYVLTETLESSFEEGDERWLHWVDSVALEDVTYRYPFKYKIKYGDELTEYSMVIRLAELYLIRAEASAMQEDFAGSASDINIIRSRAGLSPGVADNKVSLLAAVEQERRVELFSEWGHRWLDLKRTGRADAVLAPVKGEGWQPTDVLYPIPQSERDNDKALSQNAGY